MRVVEEDQITTRTHQHLPWSYDGPGIWNLLEMLRLLASDWNEIIRQLELLENPLNTEIFTAALKGPKDKIIVPLKRIARICASLELDFSLSLANEMIADIEASQTLMESFESPRVHDPRLLVQEEDIYNPIAPKKSKVVDLNQLHGRIGELKRRIDDQVALVDFYIIEHPKRPYLIDPYLFGVGVADRFPGAIVDIEEAGKCFAFSRHTACVFHLMRVMEIGLRELGASLNDPDLDPRRNPTWERILRRCDKELAESYDKRSQEWNARPRFFADATANLRAVKDAWRNPSLHVDMSYDEEKTKEIWNAVRAFMRHLAVDMQARPDL